MVQKSNSVLVKNISSTATQKDLETFFGYCGKIASLNLYKDWKGNPENAPADCNQEAIIQFESHAAVETALFLHAAFISGKAIEVLRVVDDDMEELPLHDKEDPTHHNANPAEAWADPSNPSAHNTETPHENQPARPRNPDFDNPESASSVITNLLANGYILAADTKQKAKEFDDKKGWSATIKSKASEIDNKYHIEEKANNVKQSIATKTKEIDAKYNFSGAFNSFTSAVSTAANNAAKKAMENPTINKSVTAAKQKANEVSQKATEIKEESLRKVSEKREADKTEKAAEHPEPSH
eukprot:TRINITY_DN1801_c0_g1_i3.p1 TRINITY_DN1801_c0_g1~~TRINITY_DN1801_c0_g1_i3.p1  ORF type:complete len:297 (+),score=78.26 TRINITY_DN1801_c0_g1_i3:88-978(+)